MTNEKKIKCIYCGDEHMKYDCPTKKREVKVTDLIKEENVNDVYIRYRWSEASLKSSLIIEEKEKSLTLSNYHHIGLIKILSDMIKDNPNCYIVCVTYALEKDGIFNHNYYSDTQIASTGTGADVSDVVREFEEEIGITADKTSIIEISTENKETINWKNFICAIKSMTKQTTYSKMKGFSRKEYYNKKQRNKVCGIIYGSLEDLQSIFSVGSEFIRKDAPDIKHIYGFDLIRCDLLLSYLTWYYNDSDVGNRTTILF
jgi:hypothetical protein